MADLGVMTREPSVRSIPSDARVINWNHKLSGTVIVNGLGGRKRVMVLGRTGGYIASVFSEVDGTWEITNLPEQYANKELLVVALDDTSTYNGDIADNVLPVA